MSDLPIGHYIIMVMSLQRLYIDVISRVGNLGVQINTGVVILVTKQAGYVLL